MIILIDQKEIKKVVDYFKSPYRVNCQDVLEALEDSGGMYVMTLSKKVGLSQPVTSHALKLLLGVGMLNKEEHDPYHFYTVNPKGIARWHRIVNYVQEQMKQR